MSIHKMPEEELAQIIEEWHHLNGGMPLWEYLGWTLEEYKAYVEKDTIKKAVFKVFNIK